MPATRLPKFERGVRKVCSHDIYIVATPISSLASRSHLTIAVQMGTRQNIVLTAYKCHRWRQRQNLRVAIALTPAQAHVRILEGSTELESWIGHLLVVLGRNVERLPLLGRPVLVHPQI